MTSTFLSDEWAAQARQLREELAGRAQSPPARVRINLVVTGVPFGDGTKEAHIDTSSGEIVVENGHLDDPDVTLTLDYETAKAIVVEQNQQAVMQAFMGGRVKVVGDMSTLLAFQGTPADPVHVEFVRRMREMTA